MKDKLIPGTVINLPVARVSPLGAFLDAGTGDTDDDILLHKNQQTRQVAVGQKIDVYLYLDNQDRLTASMRLPALTPGQAGWVRVKNVTRIGGFVDIGTEKDILLPYGEMAEPRPRTGESLLVQLYIDKSGRIAATMNVENWLKEHYKRATREVKIGDALAIRPYLITDRGTSVVTNDWLWGFIPGSAGKLAGLVRGQEVSGHVTKVDGDGRLYFNVGTDKAQSRLDDSEKLEEMLKRRGGSMPYTDDTPPEIIQERFGMSKSAFKRAMGRLMKDGKVIQEDGWTRFIERNL